MKPILEILLAIKLFSLWAVLIGIDMGLMVSKKSYKLLHEASEKIQRYIQRVMEDNADIIT